MSEGNFDKSFWNKLKKFALTAGQEVVEKALILYYTARDQRFLVGQKM